MEPKNWRVQNLNDWRESNPGYQDGEKNPKWLGGTCYSTTYRRTKKALATLGIDTHTCMQCGATDKKKSFNTHHKDENRLNNERENLEILCPACHNSGMANARHGRERDDCGRFRSSKFSFSITES